ncbi:MAG: hypothetical protein ABII21_03150 [bacterium]
MVELVHSTTVSVGKNGGWWSGLVERLQPKVKETDEDRANRENLATGAMLECHPLIPLVNLAIEHTRLQVDSDDKWNKLDFLEQFVLTKLSRRARKEEIRKKAKLNKDKPEEREELPRVRPLDFKDPEKRVEFSKRWKDITEADTTKIEEINILLEDIYQLWRVNSGHIAKDRDLYNKIQEVTTERKRAALVKAKLFYT